MALSRSTCVNVYASNRSNSSVNRVQVLRKRFENARAPVTRDHVTKVATIASVDIKFITEFFNELDEFHKEVFNSLNLPLTKSFAVAKPNVDEAPINGEKGEDGDGEPNIFK